VIPEPTSQTPEPNLEAGHEPGGAGGSTPTPTSTLPTGELASSSTPAEHAGVGGLRGALADVSRRTFMRTSAMTAAAAGAVAAVPGLSGFLATAENDAPAVNAAVADTSGAGGGIANMVAHITNVETGELSVYVGEHQIVVNDPALVQRLARAAGR